MFVYRDSPRDSDARFHQTLSRASSLREIDHKEHYRPRSGQVERRRKDRHSHRPKSAQVESMQYGDDGYLVPRTSKRRTQDVYASPRSHVDYRREDERPYVVQLARPSTREFRREYRDDEYYRQVVKRRPRSLHRSVFFFAYLICAQALISSHLNCTFQSI